MARAQASGWNFVALDLGIDLTTAAGEFMANVMASAAQWELLPPEVAARIHSAHQAGAGWSALAR
jgi:hypothetical protein